MALSYGETPEPQQNQMPEENKSGEFKKLLAKLQLQVLIKVLIKVALSYGETPEPQQNQMPEENKSGEFKKLLAKLQLQVLIKVQVLCIFISPK